MVRKILILFLVLAVVLVMFPQEAKASTDPYDSYSAYLPRTMPIEKRHLRGVWITTVQNLDWPSAETAALTDDSQRIKASKNELIAILDKAVSLNMNAVFFQVSPEADAFYKSELVPWSRYLTGTFGKDPGFDPLAFLIEQAHERNLEVHAWFNPYRVSVSSSTSVRESLKIEKSVYKEHPAWIKVASNRFVVDPGIPNARKWVINRVMEVVRNYDVDGVHFDDYFYYESTSSKLNDQKTYETYNKGRFSNIGDWRRDNTYMLIKELSEEVRSEKPWVKFGISPSGVWRNKTEDPEGSNTANSYTNYDSCFADTKKWVEEELIDYIAPQIYYTFANSRASYGEVATWWSDVVKGKNVHLYIGQALYKINDDSDKWFKGANAIREISNQLKMNISHEEISGSILFRAKNISDERKQQAVANITDNVWNTIALVPVMPWKGGEAPQKPSSAGMVPVTGGIRIVWRNTDPTTAYYAIYRFSKGETITTEMPAAGNLIATVRNKDGDIQEFTDVNGGKPGDVNYVVTSLDRLHHESEGTVINTSESAFFVDILPDYAWARDSIDSMVQENIIMGDGNGLFYPADTTKRGDFVLMLNRAFNLTAETESSFEDVPAGSYYYEGIGIARKLGIIKESGTRFRPDDFITREEMMVMLLRALSVSGYEIELTGEDILHQYEDAGRISNYARPAVACLVKAGIIKGSNNVISPEAYATRAEIAVFLCRVLQQMNNYL